MQRGKVDAIPCDGLPLSVELQIKAGAARKSDAAIALSLSQVKALMSNAKG